MKVKRLNVYIFSQVKNVASQSIIATKAGINIVEKSNRTCYQ